MTMPSLSLFRTKAGANGAFVTERCLPEEIPSFTGFKCLSYCPAHKAQEMTSDDKARQETTRDE